MEKRGILTHQKWLSCLKSFIEGNLKAQQDEKIKMKYVWLKNYLNLTLDKYKQYGIGKL
jgi:hypothetical protein